MTRNHKTKSKKNPTKQRISKSPKKKVESNVGYKNPPKEHQFPPGQSGNPNGSPPATTQLWRYFCKYMNLTDNQLEKLKAKKLKQNQQAAIVLVENFKAGKFSGSGKLARYIIDREEGRALETVKITGVEPLSVDECEQIREILRKNGSVD